MENKLWATILSLCSFDQITYFIFSVYVVCCCLIYPMLIQNLVKILENLCVIEHVIEWRCVIWRQSRGYTFLQTLFYGKPKLQAISQNSLTPDEKNCNHQHLTSVPQPWKHRKENSSKRSTGKEGSVERGVTFYISMWCSCKLFARFMLLLIDLCVKCAWVLWIEMFNQGN